MAEERRNYNRQRDVRPEKRFHSNECPENNPRDRPNELLGVAWCKYHAVSMADSRQKSSVYHNRKTAK
jgi:hypothetical protein